MINFLWSIVSTSNLHIAKIKYYECLLMNVACFPILDWISNITRICWIYLSLWHGRWFKLQEEWENCTGDWTTFSSCHVWIHSEKFHTRCSRQPVRQAKVHAYSSLYFFLACSLLLFIHSCKVWPFFPWPRLAVNLYKKGKDPNFGQRSILTSKILINCLFTSFFLAIKRPTCIYHFKNLNMLAIFTELTKYLNLME